MVRTSRMESHIIRPHRKVSRIDQETAPGKLGAGDRLQVFAGTVVLIFVIGNTDVVVEISQGLLAGDETPVFWVAWRRAVWRTCENLTSINATRETVECGAVRRTDLCS